MSAATEAESPRTTTVALPPLDARAPLFPPVTLRTMLRAGGVLGVIWLLGAVLALTGEDRLRLLGAGLMLPGGGHLASGHPLHTLGAVLALVTAVLIWWMIGAVVVPIAVWALDLALGVTMAHHHLTDAGLGAVAAAGPALAAFCLAAHAVRHTRRRQRAARLNAGVLARPATITRVPSRVEPPVREASTDDLERLRFALDLALQPVSSFDGFDRRDQFREAALRYQLCLLGYALAAYRHTCAPAFGGYLTEAHARSIEKMGDRRVWGYWALENAWGRLSLSRDPVDNNDNVMLTGWQGVSVGLFETFDDTRFSAPGGLTYRWSDEETYSYDLPALASSIAKNMERSAFTLFSCEPRWIYPVCNTFAVNTLLMDRRLHGGAAYDRLHERIRTAYLTEFHRPDGRVVGVRSETLGMSWSPWAGDGVWLPTTYWLHPAYPDIAHRSWRLLRETVLRERDGHFVLPATLANRCDSGSYAFGGVAFGQILLAMAAREIGDEDVAVRVLAHLADTEPIRRAGGAARYGGVSTQGNLYELMARFGRASGMRDLIGGGLPDTWRTGPRLADADYPDVLVARAHTDGAALHCVLAPGAGPLRTAVVVDRLTPGRPYHVRGALEREIVADRTGRSTLTLDLGGRLELDVEPRP
ncbi:hypothetical protein ACTD5D_11520 [Nocardia takedensis]|uniref:linalool dehydratase/isomerase domain-containing protein n=1 Tax=Nocardia takedensis TaxID=259390 RepID=UPI0002E363FD|nr:hypothetical protein [Nocardia takedensis]